MSVVVAVAVVFFVVLDRGEFFCCSGFAMLLVSTFCDEWRWECMGCTPEMNCQNFVVLALAVAQILIHGAMAPRFQQNVA